MSVLSVICMQYHERPEVGIRSPRIEVKDGCELLYGYWSWTWASLEERYL